MSCGSVLVTRTGKLRMVDKGLMNLAAARSCKMYRCCTRQGLFSEPEYPRWGYQTAVICIRFTVCGMLAS